jgi:molybdopterin-guanine dinucleotide biosynthesis protein B
MPPIVSVIGKSKSGKTSLIEELVAELKSRHYRVATIKHAAQNINFDEPGKDSWRHLQAGSEATALVSNNKVRLIKSVTPDGTLDEVARLLGDDYDIIISEGFKQADAPKILVNGGEPGLPLTGIKRLIAVIGDEPLKTRVRQFSRRDVKGLADLLEEGFIKPQRDRLAIYVNGDRVILKSFPRKIIANILINMVSSLKGVNKVKSLDISLRRQLKKAS